MRRGSGGEGVSAGKVRFRKNGESKNRGNNRLRVVLPKQRQRSQSLRKSTMPKHATAAMKVAIPPVERATSPISCWGLSQKSKLSQSGPDKYHPSHSRTVSLTDLCFTGLILTSRPPKSKGAFSNYSAKSSSYLMSQSRTGNLHAPLQNPGELGKLSAHSAAF